MAADEGRPLFPKAHPSSPSLKLLLGPPDLEQVADGRRPPLVPPLLRGSASGPSLMGCTVSKMEEGGGGAAEKLGQPMRRRIEEIKKWGALHGGRIVRKDSILSTTELLRPEEKEDTSTVTTDEEISQEGSLRCEGVCSACEAASPTLPRESTTSTTHPATTIMPSVGEVVEGARAEEDGEVAASHGSAALLKEREGEQKNKKNALEEDERERREALGKEENGRDEMPNEQVDGGAARVGGGRRRLWEEEELPGSPSFRVYCVGSLPESSVDDSAELVVSDAGKRDRKERNNINKSTTLENSESKSTKKRRGGRMKALRRGPSTVYGLLNVHSCYCQDGNVVHRSTTLNLTH